VGPEIFIPPDLDRPQLEIRRQGVERLLNQLTAEAEQWAVGGEQRVGAVPVFRQGLLLDGEPAGGPNLRVAPANSRPRIASRSQVTRRVAG
jgi:hypothetical protein